jgi:hypothetical protein
MIHRKEVTRQLWRFEKSAIRELSFDFWIITGFDTHINEHEGQVILHLQKSVFSSH